MMGQIGGICVITMKEMPKYLLFCCLLITVVYLAVLYLVFWSFSAVFVKDLTINPTTISMPLKSKLDITKPSDSEEKEKSLEAEIISTIILYETELIGPQVIPPQIDIYLDEENPYEEPVSTILDEEIFPPDTSEAASPSQED